MARITRVTIEIEFITQPKNPKYTTITIPWDARVVWYTDHGKLRFAYQIGECFWTPILKELRRFASYYDTKAYKSLSEYMKGETVELEIVCL